MQLSDRMINNILMPGGTTDDNSLCLALDLLSVT